MKRLNYDNEIPKTTKELHSFLWSNGFKGRLYRDKQGYIAITKQKAYPIPFKTLRSAFYSGWLKAVTQ